MNELPKSFSDLGESRKRNMANIIKILKTNPELDVEHKKYNINVTSLSNNLLSPEEVLAFIEQTEKVVQYPSHLYFHIPLCSYICKFCNYVKKKTEKGNERNEVNKWISLLKKEAEIYLKQFSWIKDIPINSVYFGGGTAALLQPNEIKDFLKFIYTEYNTENVDEISLEGNPDNFLGDKAKSFFDQGINRFSVGVQSFQDSVLSFSGRGHTSSMAEEAILNLKKLNVPFNVDLIFGLPFQDLNSVLCDTKKLCEWEVPTITIYRLRNADRQSIGIGHRSAWNSENFLKKNHIIFPKTNETYTMREQIVEILMSYGYRASPCGWWSRENTYKTPGNIPRVSQNKWQRFDTMLAYGPGVYGWYNCKNGRAIQTHNQLLLSKYEKIVSEGRIPLAFGRKLQDLSYLSARLGFAYKANQPIDLDIFSNEMGYDVLKINKFKDVIDDLCSRGFLLADNERKYFPTPAGEHLHEEIISILIHKKLDKEETTACKKF